MAGRRSPQSQSISQLTSQPDTIPSCHRRLRQIEFQPLSGRHHKISRDDILAQAYAQCRSNKGAPGVDGQDFADIEAYGVQRWLGELALAIRQETYRPEPIR